MSMITFKPSKEYESGIKKVLGLRKKGLYSEGINLLQRMNREYKNDKAILGLLGTLFYENQDYKNSSKYYKIASAINPSSELSSLGLFHSYMELGKINLALKEINRFIKGNTPKLYKTTLKELKDNIDNFSKPEKRQISNLIQ